ncbi:MAG: Panacea domain-containing protein [Bacteroidota bacterium]
MATKSKDFAQIDSLVLSDYILYMGGSMSHLKLQKLLFYVQAYHLAYFEKPLIEDDFQAWAHGPVSRKVYNSLKDNTRLYDQVSYVRGPKEEHVKKIVRKTLTDDQKNLVDEVVEMFSDLTGLQLENLTHNEKPWIKARKGVAAGERSDNVISKDSIRKFYRKELYGS